MNLIRSLPLVSLVLLLSACGGGGGGGGGVGSTPAPTPSTPSFGSNVNASMVQPLSSEDFTNNAAKVTSGSSATAGAADLHIIYDAGDKSYYLTADGKVDHFLDTQKVALPDPECCAQKFVKTSSGVTSTLQVTDPAPLPGLKFSYLGLATWQRETSSGKTTYYVTYGVETPSASMPLSGGAIYNFNLSGNDNSGQQYGGGGNLDARFATGQFTIDGYFTKDGSKVGTLAGNGSIASSNALSGNFTSTLPQNFAGSVAGRFYGPSAQELGMTFAGNGTGGSAIAGFIFGRKDIASPLANPTVSNLVHDKLYTEREVRSGVTLDSAGGVVSADAVTTGTSGLFYNSVDKSFTYHGVTFTEAQKTVSANGRFLVYDQGNGNRLTLYRPGDANTELQLSYVSYAKLQQVTPAAGGGMTTQYFAVPFGARTPFGATPTSGSATYSGVLDGRGTNAAYAYALTGSIDLAMAFGSGTFSANLSPVGINQFGGGPVAFGTTSFNGTINNGTGEFRSDNSQSLVGAFFGPTASEVGGTFWFSSPDPSAGGQSTVLNGVFVGRKN